MRREFLFGLVLLASQLLWSQNTSDLVRAQDEILRREQKRQDEKLKEFQNKKSRSSKLKKIPLRDKDKKSRCIEFQSIILKGADSLSLKEKSNLKSPYVNKCITLSEIDNLIRSITNLYIDKGYVTSRAYLSAQSIQNKTLSIVIIEGRVNKIEIFENGKPRKGFKNSFPNSEGKHLNLRKLEQGIDQVNRLSQYQAKIEMKPSKQAGGSNVIVNSQFLKKWYSRLTYDNYGQSSTGKDQLDLTAGIDDVLGLYESLYVSARSDLEFDEFQAHSRGLTGGFSLPFGYWTISGTASYFQYLSRIQSVNQSFESSGISRSYRLEVDRVIHRGSDSKTNISSWASLKDSDNFIEDSRLDTSSRRLSQVGLKLSNTSRLFGGSASASIEYTRGVRFLGALKDPSNIGSNDPRAQFEKYSLNLSYYKPLRNKALALSFSGVIQWSPDTLFGTERFGLGGVYTIRGFRDASITGDRGGYLRSEFIQYLPMFKSIGSLQSFMSFDTGWIKRDDDESFERGNMQGFSVGLKLRNRSFNASISIEKPVRKPEFITESTGIYRLRVGYSF